MKLDPYKHKQRFLNWKEKTKTEGIPEISKRNSEIIMQYIIDMENGLNVSISSSKGSRSYIRLNSLREKIVFFARKFEEKYNIDYMPLIKEDQLMIFFNEMKNGNIKRKDGKDYYNTYDFIKDFKAFWHWYIKINRKKGVIVEDITVDLDNHRIKPKWVYLNEEQVKQFINKANNKYKVLIKFLIDSGIRAPTELMNIRVADLHNDCKELNIRDEISKTFGRRIKLLLCTEELKNFIKENDLKPQDYLFQISPPSVNKYLKRLATSLFGDKESLAGEKYSNISMYDFRHISCCYWLPLYKSESALKYRFGWKESDKIHYYSEMLGMKDTITEDDLLVDVTKTQIEQRLQRTEKEKDVLQERINTLELQMKKILQMVNNTCFIIKNN
ncbi:MAG: hypothetical protein WC979_07030 [Candidatus Pacearchaeota archaeon]|jgi:hypothetical protein